MLEYKSPTFLEMPEVTSYLIEDPDPVRRERNWRTVERLRTR